MIRTGGVVQKTCDSCGALFYIPDHMYLVNDSAKEQEGATGNQNGVAVTEPAI